MKITKPDAEKLLIIFILAVLAALCFWAWRTGIFHDLASLRACVERVGWAAPVIPVMLHILQILVPFIPGGLVLAAVVVIFGPWQGFVINFAGVISGSALSFALARYFGQDFVRKRIKPAIWQKYFRWLDNEKLFLRTFLVLILLPFAPDDALCMLAGISKISTRSFMLIIIFCKIPVMLLYSLGMLGADALL